MARLFSRCRLPSLTMLVQSQHPESGTEELSPIPTHPRKFIHFFKVFVLFCFISSSGHAHVSMEGRRQAGNQLPEPGPETYRERLRSVVLPFGFLGQRHTGKGRRIWGSRSPSDGSVLQREREEKKGHGKRKRNKPEGCSNVIKDLECAQAC